MIIRQRIRSLEQFVREMLNRCSIPTVTSSGLFFRLLELWPASMHLLQALSEFTWLLGPKDFDLKGSITWKKQTNKQKPVRVANSCLTVDNDHFRRSHAHRRYCPLLSPTSSSFDYQVWHFCTTEQEPQSNQRARTQEKTCTRTPAPHVAAVSSLTLNGDTNQPSSCKFPSPPFVLGEVSAISIFNERGDIEC